MINLLIRARDERRTLGYIRTETRNRLLFEHNVGIADVERALALIGDTNEG